MIKLRLTEDQFIRSISLITENTESTARDRSLQVIRDYFAVTMPYWNVDDVFNVSFINDEVKLKFKGNKKSGTYIITFLEGAIQDRYGNIMDEFSVIFSTNNLLDNYKLRGKVYDLMTSQNLPDKWKYKEI